MSVAQTIQQQYPGRLLQPKSRDDLPDGQQYMVYIRVHDGHPIILGHGKKNRASVIFDTLESSTTSHIKALIVRLYILFGSPTAKTEQFVISCGSKAEAARIESNLHMLVGGNTLKVPPAIKDALLDGIPVSSPAWMALRMALCSSFDGITDLKRWRKEQILDDHAWLIVADRLKLV